MTSRESLSGTEDQARPKPCKRHAKMILNPKFLAHLPDCRACKSVLADLNRESELKPRTHDMRTLRPRRYTLITER